MRVVWPLRLFACRGQRRGRVRDSGGYYLQMVQARADGGLSSSASWFTVAYERDLPTAGRDEFRSLIVPASCLEPRARNRLELELNKHPSLGYARSLRQLVELERAFVADVPSPARRR